MDEGKFYSKVLQAVIVEILNQVGFERTSKQSLQVILDLVFSHINKQLLIIKRILSEAGLCEAHNSIVEIKEPETDTDLVNAILSAIIEESTGPEESYKREELVSFLQYQLNITKQIKKRQRRRMNHSSRYFVLATS